MSLRDILKKKDKAHDSEPDLAPPTPPPKDDEFQPPSPPGFTFVRTTTGNEEIIHPPSFASDNPQAAPSSSLGPEAAVSKSPKRFSHFRRSSSRNSNASTDDERHSQGRTSHEHKHHHDTGESLQPKKDKHEKRLSQRLEEKLHIGGSRGRSASSSNVPLNLPAAPQVFTTPPKDSSGNTPSAQTSTRTNEEKVEAEWEKRATLLARGNQRERSRSIETRSPRPSSRGSGVSTVQNDGPVDAIPPPQRHARKISGVQDDVTIQEAIRLHESGSLEASTRMFGQLADPGGENNALSQVLYGLALRHGWGCTPNPEQSLHYLTLAATNSAAVESTALNLGQAKGGAAKGELILAIYELANSFRQGWGVEKDPVAARTYYETAANLGDTDAMGEVAWCYESGFGGKKDRWKAAQYLRRAEQRGVKGVGNSWIWKPKYDPKPS